MKYLIIKHPKTNSPLKLIYNDKGMKLCLKEHRETNQCTMYSAGSKPGQLSRPGGDFAPLLPCVQSLTVPES